MLNSFTEYNPAAWKKNLFILSISQFIYRAGSRSIIPFLPLFIQDLGKTNSVNTAVWSGWIFAAPFIISFFTTPFWGGFGDKYGRKLITLFAIFGFAASQMLMGLSSSLSMLLVFSSLQELMGGFYPSSVSLIASNAPKEDTARALGYFQFAGASGSIIGPIIGGIIADTFGCRQVFFLVAVTSTFCGLIILLFVKDDKIQAKQQNYFSLAKNWKYVLERKILVICILFLLLHALGITIIRPTFTLFIGSFHFASFKTSTVAGFLLGIFGFASAISSAFVGKISQNRNLGYMLIIAVLLTASTLLIVPAVSSLVLISSLLIINGLALGLMLPLAFTLISSNTESDRKAGIIGVGSSMQIVGNLFGSITAGYIAANFGLSSTFLFSGFLFLLTIPLLSLKSFIKNK